MRVKNDLSAARSPEADERARDSVAPAVSVVAGLALAGRAIVFSSSAPESLALPLLAVRVALSLCLPAWGLLYRETSRRETSRRETSRPCLATRPLELRAPAPESLVLRRRAQRLPPRLVHGALHCRRARRCGPRRLRLRRGLRLGDRLGQNEALRRLRRHGFRPDRPRLDRLLPPRGQALPIERSVRRRGRLRGGRSDSQDGEVLRRSGKGAAPLPGEGEPAALGPVVPGFAHRPVQSPLRAGDGPHPGVARQALPRAAPRLHARHRPLQKGQRHGLPRGGRRSSQGRSPGDTELPPDERLRRPLRGRRVPRLRGPGRGRSRPVHRQPHPRDRRLEKIRERALAR